MSRKRRSGRAPGAAAAFLIIFGLIFIRFCCYGLTYFPQLDDYIQLHNYTAYHPDSAEGRALADTLRGAVMAAADAPDMGVEERPDLAVLRTAAMPAALVECGFMSTPAELALLCSEDYQQRIAQGIADGVLTYLRGEK